MGRKVQGRSGRQLHFCVLPKAVHFELSNIISGQMPFTVHIACSDITNENLITISSNLFLNPAVRRQKIDDRMCEGNDQFLNFQIKQVKCGYLIVSNDTEIAKSVTLEFLKAAKFEDTCHVKITTYI